jgi:hypothetical protein
MLTAVPALLTALLVAKRNKQAGNSTASIAIRALMAPTYKTVFQLTNSRL